MNIGIVKLFLSLTIYRNSVFANYDPYKTVLWRCQMRDCVHLWSYYFHCYDVKTETHTIAPTEDKSLPNNFSDDYKLFDTSMIIYISILGVLLMSVICHKYKKSIMVFLYAHGLCLLCIPSRPYDSAKEYDAFVLFSPNEPSLIWEYVRELENGKRKFKFCYWSTEDSQESTLNSMVASKEIIILMTRDYLKSELCRMNFYLAMQATSMDRFKQMIVIIYPDVGNIEDFGKEMKTFLELCTCIERDSFMFWNKLVFTLPHQTKHDDNNLKEVVINDNNSKEVDNNFRAVVLKVEKHTV